MKFNVNDWSSLVRFEILVMVNKWLELSRWNFFGGIFSALVYGRIGLEGVGVVFYT